MFIPEGYTKRQVLDDIDHVVKHLSPHFKFGYYDDDDMMQEGYIFALEVLKDYDASRDTELRTFLYTHVRNRFINIKRDKYFRTQSPCTFCDIYKDKFSYYAILVIEFIREIFQEIGLHDSYMDSICCNNETNCKKWTKWLSLNVSKKNLIEGQINVEVDTEIGGCVDDKVLENLATRELIQLLDKHIPLRLRADYRRLLEGSRLPKQRRLKVIEAARQILNKTDLAEEIPDD